MEKSIEGCALWCYEAPELRLVRLSRVGTELLRGSNEGYGSDLDDGSWLGNLTGGSEGYGGDLDDGSWLGNLTGGSEGYGGDLGGGSWLSGGLTGGTGNESLETLGEGSWEP